MPLFRALELLLCFSFLAISIRWALGALASKAAIGALLFLVTRWPVLIVSTLGATGWAILLLSSHRPGATPMPAVAALALSAFLGLGTAALTVGPSWAVLRAFAPKPTLSLEPGEHEISRRAANHFLRGEARGGKLVVTDRRAVFVPHRFNVQVDVWSVPLGSIRSLRTSGISLLVLDTGEGLPTEWIVVQDPAGLAGELQRAADRAYTL